ncbi:MAG: hypothetical protein BGN88_13635 [Clostridiales bacterium 43-6]|nr:MAG: hypothetical protein BGN88_13635 [Clostridiales bacterium 43-6]
MKQYTHIIWDWNGTLLDDVGTSVQINNEMLQNRGVLPIAKEDYLDIIEMPLVNYYAKLFDLERDSFDELSLEFIKSYEERTPEMGLMDGAVEVLSALQNRGIKQIILSSFEEGIIRTLTKNLGVSGFFDEIIGRNDYKSDTKTQAAINWVEKNKIDTSKLLVVGDLIHDSEMASEIGADCVLIANGHQSKERLQQQGVPVLTDIREITKYIG